MYIIVEDDNAVADALRSLLAEAGHDVEVFADAEALIGSLRPASDDTVIVDLGLPGMTGGQLMRLLSEFDEPPRLIAISGKSSRVIDSETRGVSRLTVLRKPPSADWLAAITN